jgi:hypothetical protein
VFERKDDKRTFSGEQRRILSEDLRESVVELLARYVLAEAREEFVRSVVEAKRN